MKEKQDIRNKVKRESNYPSFLEHGKLPPQACDIEEAVLGALMLEKDALSQVIDILIPEVFYKDAHQKIFSAIFDLFARSEAVDILTVTQELKKRGELELVGGPYYITRLTNPIGSAANIEYHSRIIQQKYMQRELIRISSEATKDSYDDSTDVFELLDKAEQDLYDIRQNNTRKNYTEASTLLMESLKEIEEAGKNKDGISGVPSGFSSIDKITGGWQKSDLIVLAARPGKGKTSAALSFARNTVIDYKKPVAVFSLEMSNRQLMKRLISGETGISSGSLKSGRLTESEWSTLSDKTGKLHEAQIFIDDTPSLSIFELRAKCRRLKIQHDIELIIVDYIQLMRGEKGGNREQEISSISRGLKQIAMELDIPVIVLSQLSRAVETRGGSKKPILSDLRESGAIEQDADIVAFLYRPEYYKLNEDEFGNNTDGLAEVDFAKHRNGALETAKLHFEKDITKFTDLENDDYFTESKPPDIRSEEF